MKTFGEYVTSRPCPSSRSARASAQSSSRGRSSSSIEGAYASTGGLHEIECGEAEQRRERQNRGPGGGKSQVARPRSGCRHDGRPREAEREADESLDRLEGNAGSER